MKKIYIITTTYPNAREARALCDYLLANRLASCIQIHRAESHYVWRDNIEAQEEFIVHIKTAKSRVKAIKSHIKATHSYEIPQILVSTAKASKAYFKWHTQAIEMP